MSDESQVENALPTPDSKPIPEKGERCRFLLSKGMYLNFGLPDGEEVTGDGNFWCGRNQRNRGPDNQLCTVEACRDPRRTCYEVL